jgi:hypothetical protein
MAQILIAGLILIGFVAGLKFGLKEAFLELGFWPGMATCLLVGGSAIAAAFAYDRVKARSQPPPPRELNDRPPSMK